jgi:hypothetical protein
MLLSAVLLCAGVVEGQYDGIPSYAQKEASLVVEGGCVLDCLAVYNRACALISETVPFYYLDPVTKTIEVNESKAETNIKWVCWGAFWKNNFPEIDPNGWVDYSVGFGMGPMQTACGIEFDTWKIICFGANNPSQDSKGLPVKGQAEPPLGKFKQLDMGGLHGCALAYDFKTEIEYKNSLVCWGNNRMGQTSVPVIIQTSVLTKISYNYTQVGWEHSCALRTDHRLACWGSNLDAAVAIPDSVRATKTKDGGQLSRERAYGCCQVLCVCVCVRVCSCVYAYTCVFVCVYICIRTYIHTTHMHTHRIANNATVQPSSLRAKRRDVGRRPKSQCRGTTHANFTKIIIVIIIIIVIVVVIISINNNVYNNNKIVKICYT